MRRHRAATASIVTSVILLSCAGAGSIGARAASSLPVLLRGSTADVSGARLSERPFAPPPPFALRDTDPIPFVDVTGSIPARVSDIPSLAGLGLKPDATFAPQVSADEGDPAIPPPEMPAAPVVDPAPQAPRDIVGLQTANLVEALKAFSQPDPTKRAGETVQAKQRQSDREAIAVFYAGRANAPLWIDANHFSTAARSAMARIERAGEDGLDLHGFAIPVLHNPTPAQLAEADIALSEAVVAYAHQAGGSRIDPLHIDRLITAKRTLAAVADVLGPVQAAADPGAALQGFNPPQPGYAALRDKLAELRQAAPVARDSIPLGPTLKLGMRDARVPLVRSRFGLGASTDTSREDLVYDTKVAEAVAAFQRVNGLPASGALTPRTIAALSGGDPTRLENELIANMEEWRWVPRDLGTDHLDVNVPDYSLDVVMNGEIVHRARVVVGRPDHQTPIFSDAIRFIIVNPYWNVPLSIIKKEMLPKLAENPNYFSDHGYEVVQRDGITYVRQPPGEDNALGRIKFMFPNEHSVYLHDTNARALFNKQKRALSHGCVRVDQPFKLAEVVLGKESGWTEKRVEKLIGGQERTINLPKPLPIHIMYFTAFVDQGGKLQLRDDLYGYSSRVKVALGLKD